MSSVDQQIFPKKIEIFWAKTEAPAGIPMACRACDNCLWFGDGSVGSITGFCRVSHQQIYPFAVDRAETTASVGVGIQINLCSEAIALQLEMAAAAAESASNAKPADPAPTLSDVDVLAIDDIPEID